MTDRDEAAALLRRIGFEKDRDSSHDRYWLMLAPSKKMGVYLGKMGAVRTAHITNVRGVAGFQISKSYNIKAEGETAVACIRRVYATALGRVTV